MNEIICPHCKKTFKVDEAGFADISAKRRLYAAIESSAGFGIASRYFVLQRLPAIFSKATFFNGIIATFCLKQQRIK